MKLRLPRVADRKNILVTGLQFICGGGIGKKDYGGLISHIGTLNPTVSGRALNWFKLHREAVELGGLGI